MTNQTFEFTIIISKDGETVTGEVHGIKGKSCSEVQHVLDEIGREVEHRHTYEYHEREPVRIGGKLGGGKLQLGSR